MKTTKTHIIFLLSVFLLCCIKANGQDYAWLSNNNFMVTPRGIVFVYNPYDIAPYDNGIIHITVPWSELKSILVK